MSDSRHLHLVHRSGTDVVLDVTDAAVRPSKIADGFDLQYTSDSTTILFLRTDNFDAVILRDGDTP